MSLLHFDSSWNWLGTIMDYQFGRGGYTNMQSQHDVKGGHAGAQCDLSMLAPAKLQNILSGHFIVQVEHQRPLYVGRVIGAPDKTDPQLLMMGPAAFWLQNREFSYTFAVGGNTASFIAWILQNACEASYGLDTVDTSYIQNGAYTLATAPAWTQTKVGGVISELNSFEGYEYGSFIPVPGRSLTEKVKFFFRPPDTTTIHYTVDARTLKQPAKIPPDTSGFANYLIVYYGSATPPASQVYAGTATSQNRFGVIWDRIDISGSQPVTSISDANQVAANYFSNEMVDGVETPPVNLDLVIDDDTKVRRVNGRFRDHMHIEPGTNFLLTGLPHSPKHLKAVDRKVIIHSTVVKREHHIRRSTHTCHRHHDPSVIVARLKSKYNH